MEEEKVKWPSKKKFTCKRNKGEHEYLSPIIKYQPSVDYVYQTKNTIMYSPRFYPEQTPVRAEVTIVLETQCKHCGHKCVSYLRDKIN